jgi:hypothetical protein
MSVSKRVLNRCLSAANKIFCHNASLSFNKTVLKKNKNAVHVEFVRGVPARGSIATTATTTQATG